MRVTTTTWARHGGRDWRTRAAASACIEKALAAYIVDLVAPPPGTVCPADHKPFGLS